MIKCLSADKHSEESLEMLKILWFTNCLDGVDSDWIIGCGQDCRKWSSTKLADGTKWFVPFAHINVLITLDKRGYS